MFMLAAGPAHGSLQQFEWNRVQQSIYVAFIVKGVWKKMSDIAWVC